MCRRARGRHQFSCLGLCGPNAFGVREGEIRALGRACEGASILRVSEVRSVSIVSGISVTALRVRSFIVTSSRALASEPLRDPHHQPRVVETYYLLRHFKQIRIQLKHQNFCCTSQKSSYSNCGTGIRVHVEKMENIY